MKLSGTAVIVLGNAADRDDRMVPRRPNSPPIADINACRTLVRSGLLETTSLPNDGGIDLVTTKEDDRPMGFRITDAGLCAISQDPPDATPETSVMDANTAPHAAADATVPEEAAAVADAPDATSDVAATGASTAPHTPTEDAPAQESVAAADAPDAAPVTPTVAVAPPRTKTTLRDAARVVLKAWDDRANRDTDIGGALEAPMASLRGLLSGPAPRANAPRKPREGTKQQAVLTLLRRTEGTTIAQVMDTTGWASHTVRGFFAGLKKKGIPVETLERVRQVGPDKQGAKGSYTIYHVATLAAV